MDDLKLPRTVWQGKDPGEPRHRVRIVQQRYRGDPSPVFEVEASDREDSLGQPVWLDADRWGVDLEASVVRALALAVLESCPCESRSCRTRKTFPPTRPGDEGGQEAMARKARAHRLSGYEGIPKKES